ncbi:hypothetical protein ACFQ1S_03400 [Kibdelosporangium lantanae]|uniref:Integrase catalytic domain-containing protein n=1 Tax=Kibdelosporangium lantanae TaxID=1497396 RepID=A0ABW3M532_9PSEU
MLSELNETSDTVANPDGTFTMTRALRPVRVKQGQGWSPPDSTLQAKGDALAPKAVTADVSLSAPVVTGSLATYPEVLPGVDLKVEVDIDTVHEVVVVKTPDAARNPALTRFELTIPVRNGSVQKDADGTLHVIDPQGNEKFSAPPALMWDSSGLDVDGRDFVHGAAPGGRTAAVGESLSGTKLTLTPDQNLLSGKDTVYPVYVDPEWHDNYCTWCGRNHYLVEYACGSTKTAGDSQWDNARHEVIAFIEGFYNSVRLHSGLGYRTPMEVLDEWFANQQVA